MAPKIETIRLASPGAALFIDDPATPHGHCFSFDDPQVLMDTAIIPLLERLGVTVECTYTDSDLTVWRLTGVEKI